MVDRFPEWQKARQAGAGSFSSYGSSANSASGPSKASSGGSGGLLEEWELPAHLARTRYAPTEAECEAIDVSGSNPSTKATVYRMFRINGAMRESGGLTSWFF